MEKSHLKEYEKAKAKAVEAAKSDEQKAYESLRESSGQAAADLCSKNQQELAELGFRITSYIDHPDVTRPDVVVSGVQLSPIPWEQTAAGAKEKSAKAPVLPQDEPKV